MILQREYTVDTELVHELENTDKETNSLIERISEYLGIHNIIDFELSYSTGTRLSRCEITGIETQCQLVWLYG